MSRMNEEEVDGLLDHQLHIWMLATLTKMLRWEQGKLVHEARERWDTIYIYSGKISGLRTRCPAFKTVPQYTGFLMLP